MTKDLSNSFTGIEINGVRFSSFQEMLVYMDKQRTQIIELHKELSKVEGKLADLTSEYYELANLKNNEIAELKEENKKSNVLFADIIEAFTSCSYNDDFEMAQAGKEIYELFYGGKDPKEVFHNAEVPKCSRQLLAEAKDLIRNLLRVTYGEGWNYSLQVKVEAEKFLKESE